MSQNGPPGGGGGKLKSTPGKPKNPIPSLQMQFLRCPESYPTPIQCDIAADQREPDPRQADHLLLPTARFASPNINRTNGFCKWKFRLTADGHG